jgi:hypothetical protein
MVGTMAQVCGKKSASILVGLLAACLLVCGCRCTGLFSPAHNQKEVQTLLQDNAGELTTFATGWLRNHRDVDMKYGGCHDKKVTFTRYARNGTGMGPLAITIPDDREVRDLQQLAERLQLADVSVFRASNETQSWYVQLSFQGGAKWPYGLLYIPEGEPLNMLNAATGGPGPGFSKVVPVQGRWLYFESQ